MIVKSTVKFQKIDKQRHWWCSKKVLKITVDCINSKKALKITVDCINSKKVLKFMKSGC